MTDILFHATWPTQADTISREGLKHGSFFANTPGYAAAFLALRGGREIIGLKIVETDDGPVALPDFIQHHEAVVFAVPLQVLNPDRLEASHDHAAAFYPDDLLCWQYHDAIAPQSLIRLDPINISVG